MKLPLRGFTLVEIIIVIGVIGLLIGVVLPNIAAVRRRAQDEKLVADLGIIEQALHQYRQLCKTYPLGTGAGVFGEEELDDSYGFTPSGDCFSGSIITLRALLPAGFTPDWSKIQYYPLRRGDVGGVDLFRCTSFRLGVTLSSSEASPIKRAAKRGWTWEADSNGVFLWRTCGGGGLPNDFAADVYDAISPPPF